MSELPKPNAQSLANLEKIEKKIGKQLQQRPIERIMGLTNGYSCDEAGDVTGLNLAQAEIKDISFVIDFHRLANLFLIIQVF